MDQSAKTYLQLKPAKTEEISPSAQIGLLSSFLNIGQQYFFDRLLLKKPKYLSLEIVSYDQKTHFYINPPAELKGYFTSQVLSQYPKTLIIEEKTDPLYTVVKGKANALAVLTLTQTFNYPIKTFKQFTDSPPLSALLGFLGRLQAGEGACFQIIMRVPYKQSKWQKKVRSTMQSINAEGKEVNNPYNALIQQKLTTPMLECQLRLLFSAQRPEVAQARLAEFAGAFGIYTLAEGNSFIYYSVSPALKKAFFKKMVEREFYFFQKTTVLSLEELASTWHLPDKKLEKIRGVNWGKMLLSEAPDNLPVAETYENPEEKRNINFFAKTEWRNHESIFGIKREDRSKHTYVIGKTGAGKSTLIGNMAINDIRNGEGVAVIDPHGDLTEMILDYIPKRRMKDVVYLDPTLSADRAFAINLFDQEGAEHMDVVASGIVSIFYKMYANSWGPRLEYILRNTILTLLYYGDATFADLPRLLSDKKFRDKVVEAIGPKDNILAQFWIKEFNQMNERLRTDAISPIQNKVGQFLSSIRIRNVVDSRKSTFSLEEIMNNQKILLLNLSQGKLGEDTTALLGAIFITKIQLTAMRRVHVPHNERRDFYLYVDEFQNFATGSFIKILSEARKYRLNLILANQYIGQVEEDIQKAIFGNVGTLITFIIGARDAELFEKEFGGKFTADDLVSLGKYEILMKMAIDGLTSVPFFAKTLPGPSVINENKDKIISANLERYYRHVK